MSPRGLLGRVLASSAVVVTALVALPWQSAQAVGDPPQFYDGAIQYSEITDCGSIIWANPYTSKGVGAWVGATADLDETPPLPGVNQTFYIRVVVGGIGNACAGTGFRPGFTLPSGMSRDTSQPVRCFINGTQTTNAADCPQGPGAIASNYFGAGSFAYISGRTQDGRLWPAAPGATWEFQFPVRSSTVQSMATLRGHVAVADGNSNPTLRPTAGVNVFPSSGSGGGADPATGQYAIVYDQPSTFATPSHDPGTGPFTPRFGLVSEGKVFTQYRAGTIFLRRASTAARLGSASTSDEKGFGVDSSQPGWKLYTDWDDMPPFDDLVAGQRYYWRLGFQPTGGPVVWGATQSFQALPQATCDAKAVTVSLALGQLPTDGADVILGTEGNDTIAAKAGNDTVCALGGNDTIDGGLGDDWVDAGAGQDVIVPRDGNDISIGGSGSDTISYVGNPAGVSFRLGFGLDLSAQNTGGAGMDAEHGVEHLTGTSHADDLRGWSGANRLVGGSGDDTLIGNGGNDLLVPGPGHDRVDGGGPLAGRTPGNDTLSYVGLSWNKGVRVDLARRGAQNTGGSGVETITGITNVIGGSGPDQLSSGHGSGILRGGPGNDTLFSRKGHDMLHGDGGNDRLVAGSGHDRLLGGAGNDRLYGGSGNDWLYGSAGKDRLYGAAGSDRLYGDSGADRLYGESGKDRLDGGSAKDRCDGGSSRDRATRCESKKRVP